MQLYGLKNCDTCRKAIKALPDARFVDVRVEGVPAEILAAAHERFGAALVNTRSTTWRGLDADDKTAPALDLLAEHPSLMKRPLIVTQDAMYLGWTPDVQSALVSA